MKARIYNRDQDFASFAGLDWAGPRERSKDFLTGLDANMP